MQAFFDHFKVMGIGVAIVASNVVGY